MPADRLEITDRLPTIKGILEGAPETPPSLVVAPPISDKRVTFVARGLLRQAKATFGTLSRHDAVDLSEVDPEVGEYSVTRQETTPLPLTIGGGTKGNLVISEALCVWPGLLVKEYTFLVNRPQDAEPTTAVQLTGVYSPDGNMTNAMIGGRLHVKSGLPQGFVNRQIDECGMFFGAVQRGFV